MQTDHNKEDLQSLLSVDVSQYTPRHCSQIRDSGWAGKPSVDVATAEASRYDLPVMSGGMRRDLFKST